MSTNTKNDPQAPIEFAIDSRELLVDMLEPLFRIIETFGGTLRGLKKSGILNEAAFLAAADLLEQQTGQRPSDTAAALKAGVHDKVAREIRRREFYPPASPKSLLLSTWESRRPFIDENGEPRHLPLRTGIPSFRSLYKSCFGSTRDLKMVLEEFIALGCVERREDGTLALLNSRFRSSDASIDTLRTVVRAFEGVAGAIAHNLNASSYADGIDRAKHIQMTTKSWEIPVRDMPRLMRRVRQLHTEHQDRVHKEILSYEKPESDEELTTIYSGVFAHSATAFIDTEQEDL